MTFEEKFKSMLEERGMSPNQASAVIEIVEADEMNKPMAGRWNDDIEDYPQAMVIILWENVKSSAVEWIDANLPMAWYRPLFSETEQNG